MDYNDQKNRIIKKDRYAKDAQEDYKHKRIRRFGALPPEVREKLLWQLHSLLTISAEKGFGENRVFDSEHRGGMSVDDQRRLLAGIEALQIRVERDKTIQKAVGDAVKELDVDAQGKVSKQEKRVIKGTRADIKEAEEVAKKDTKRMEKRSDGSDKKKVGDFISEARSAVETLIEIGTEGFRKDSIVVIRNAQWRDAANSIRKTMHKAPITDPRFERGM